LAQLRGIDVDQVRKASASNALVAMPRLAGLLAA
jgi:hypothetical protein